MLVTVKDYKEAIKEKSDKLHRVFEASGPETDLTKAEVLALLDAKSSTEATEKIRAMNAELTDLGKKKEAREEVEGIRNSLAAPAAGLPHPIPDDERREAPKSLGRLFVESAQYKQFHGKGEGNVRNWPSPANFPRHSVVNTVFRTGAGWNPPDIRLPRVELDPQRPITVIDNIPVLGTSLDTIRYMEETTFTNNAAETAESTATTAADLIGEAALALTERTQVVEWLPVFLPVTMQQLEDVEGAEDYVNSRLTYMIQARLDLQILRGSGSTPNLLGLNNVSGITSQAKGADPTPDAVYKAMRAVRASGFAEPNVVFAHPNDWQDVRLLRTSDGIYIWGSPADAGPERIWGVRVVQTTAAAEGTMSLGDLARYAAVYIKRGISLAVSDSHANYFTRGMLAIRADMRAAVVWFRPEAFAVVTGV